MSPSTLVSRVGLASSSGDPRPSSKPAPKTAFLGDFKKVKGNNLAIRLKMVDKSMGSSDQHRSYPKRVIKIENQDESNAYSCNSNSQSKLNTRTAVTPHRVKSVSPSTISASHLKSNLKLNVYENFISHHPSAPQLLTPTCSRPGDSGKRSFGGSSSATPMGPALSDSAQSAYGSNYAI